MFGSPIYRWGRTPQSPCASVETTLLTILGITGPIFLIIGVGFAAVPLASHPRRDAPAGRLRHQRGLRWRCSSRPCRPRPGDLVDGHPLLIYTIGSLLAAGIALGAACLVRGAACRPGGAGPGASMSNSAYHRLPHRPAGDGPVGRQRAGGVCAGRGLVMMPLLPHPGRGGWAAANGAGRRCSARSCAALAPPATPSSWRWAPACCGPSSAYPCRCGGQGGGHALHGLGPGGAVLHRRHARRAQPARHARRHLHDRRRQACRSTRCACLY